MPRGKLNFDKLSGINYDVPATKTGLNFFTELFGLSPSILEGSLSLSKDILLHTTIGDGSDLVFADKYYSKTYGNTIIFIKSSNNRPYIRYKNSSGIYVVEELPAPSNFPPATDWNGVQIDTRYYLQSYDAEKRYVIRFDGNENYFNSIRLESGGVIFLERTNPTNYEIEHQDDQHTYFSVKSFLDWKGSYGIVKSQNFSDFDKDGKYLYLLGEETDLVDQYIFASSSIDPNSIPEERLIASIVDNKYAFYFVSIVFGENGFLYNLPSGHYIYTIGTNDNRFNYIDLICYYYNLAGLSYIVNQKLFIDEVEYTILNAWDRNSSGGGAAVIELDKNIPFTVPALAHNFRLEITIDGFTPLIIPLYGNDVYGGTKTIYGDLISNYTTFSENIDAYGKAVVYADGFLFNGSPKYKDEEYENYLTNSFINNLGLRQPLSFPITNLTPLGSKSGTMLVMKEKFGRIYTFTSEAIFIVDPNQGDPIVLEPIQLNITSKYHIVEFLNGFFIYSGFKMWRLGYDGIVEVLGMNKYFLDNNITEVYLSWNSIDSELMVYVTPYLKRIFIYNYNRNIWRSWIPETLARFVMSYAEDGVSYHVDLSGNIYTVSSKFGSGLVLEALLELEAFKTVDITEIRVNGNFNFSDIRAQLTLSDQSVNNLKVKLSPKGFLQLYRNEGITIKEKKVTLRIFQSIADTVSRFDVYGIEVYGIFEELEGNYPNETLTVY